MPDPLNLSLPRTAKLKVPPMVGDDIDAHGRAMHRYLADGQLASYAMQPALVRRTFGVGKRTLAKKCAAKAGLPAYGVVGPGLYAALRDAGAYDAKADLLIDAYNDRAAAPQLVEPLQGWESLHKSLWQAYSTGRLMGLTDLGTYNPASTLPGGGPSDHSVYPAYAFDLGCTPQTGQRNPTAKSFFQKMVGRPEVEYVILGDLIWSRSRGLHSYTAGGHDNHVHVSGRR